MHEAEFSTLIPVMAFVSKVSLYSSKCDSFVFCEALLKFRKFFQQYDATGAKKFFFLADTFFPLRD
jgi:hypothetical protein